MLCPEPECGCDSRVTDQLRIPPTTLGRERIYRNHVCYNRHHFRTVEQVTTLRPKQLIAKTNIRGKVGGKATETKKGQSW